MKSLRTLPFVLTFLLLAASLAIVSSGETVPSAPIDLRCTVGESYVDLSWKAPESGNVSYYLVYRGDSSDDMDVIANISANQTAYHDGGLDVGTSSYYLVTAVNPAGESAVSNAISATTESKVIIKTSPSSNEMWVAIIALVLAVVAIQISIISIWVMIKKAFK